MTPAQRARKNAINACQRDVAAAFVALNAAYDAFCKAFQHLNGTDCRWQAAACIEALDALVRVHTLERAINAIMNEHVINNTPNTFTRS